MDKNTKAMRLLIEQSKIIEQRESELWEFVRLTPEQTGLGHEIYVDNGGAYVNHNHKLWLYVDDDGEQIPVTVEKNPTARAFIRGKNIRFDDIIEFIQLNYGLLKNLADEKVDYQSFLKLIRKVGNRSVIYRNTGLLNEMATLRGNKSGLPTTIWLDDNRLYKRHAPRIKFRADFQNKDTRNDPSMEVRNPDRIHNMPPKVDLTTSQIEHIKKFVVANADNIVALSNKEIKFEAFLSLTKIVDEIGDDWFYINQNGERVDIV